MLLTWIIQAYLNVTQQLFALLQFMLKRSHEEKKIMHYYRGLSRWWWYLCQLVWFVYLKLGFSPDSFFSSLTALTTLVHNSTFEIWSLH